MLGFVFSVYALWLQYTDPAPVPQEANSTPVPAVRYHVSSVIAAKAGIQPKTQAIFF
jgi:hypothetical protein